MSRLSRWNLPGSCSDDTCASSLPAHPPHLFPLPPSFPASLASLLLWPPGPVHPPWVLGRHRVCPRPPGTLSHTGLCLQRSLLLLHSEQRKYSVWGKNFTPSGIYHFSVGELSCSVHPSICLSSGGTAACPWLSAASALTQGLRFVLTPESLQSVTAARPMILQNVSCSRVFIFPIELSNKFRQDQK